MSTGILLLSKTYFEFYAWKVNEKDVAVLLNDLTAQKENERFLN